MLKREDNEALVRVGPGTVMGEYLRRFWLPALLSSELSKPDGDLVQLAACGDERVQQFVHGEARDRLREIAAAEATA